jgi:hypothetical protein
MSTSFLNLTTYKKNVTNISKSLTFDIVKVKLYRYTISV